MNLSDTKEFKVVSKDKLEKLFEAQTVVEREFARVEGFPERLAFGKLEHLSSAEVCSHIHQLLWRLSCEIHELAVATKNAKQWRKEKYLLDANEALDEVADCWAYMITVCLAMGIDEEKLVEVFLKKAQVNLDRVRSRY